MEFSRREFIGLGAGGFLGYLLANRFDRLFALPQSEGAKAKAVIVLWMGGGPSQLDTFDPKPGRATGGPFKAIESAVKGIEISEYLPKIAAQMKKIALIRSMTSKEGNHQRATYLVHTGYPQQGTIVHPGFGSVVASEIGDQTFDLPNYISVGGPAPGAGFLGVAQNPFVVANPNQPPENLHPKYGLAAGRSEARLKLLDGQEKEFLKGRDGGEAEAHREIYRKAVRLMNSPLAKAFDLAEEKAEIRDRYGRNNFGQGCLLARRLVETGVKYVEVNLNGWDTHRDNFAQTQRLSGMLDPGFAALLEDLDGRGFLKTTIVLWMGEFGRTPKVNENEGRDHFPKAWCAAMAGGGIQGGRLIGATNEEGTDIKSRPVVVPDLFATLCELLGIDPARKFMTPQGRPHFVVDKSATPVRELVQ